MAARSRQGTLSSPHLRSANGLRVTRVARTRDRSTYAERAAGYVARVGRRLIRAGDFMTSSILASVGCTYGRADSPRTPPHASL